MPPAFLLPVANFLFAWKRWIVYVLLAVSVAVVLIGTGYHYGIKKLWAYQAEQARAAVPVIVKQGATTERIVTRWRERDAKVVTVTKTIEKEIVRYVPPAADPVLPVGWGLLHDAAATGAIPTPPAGVDVAAPGVAASVAIKGVIGNYGSCHRTAVQLIELQEWVRDQYQVMNIQPLRY